MRKCENLWKTKLDEYEKSQVWLQYHMCQIYVLWKSRKHEIHFTECEVLCWCYNTKKYITMFLTFYGHDGRSLIIMEAQQTVHGFIWKVHRWHLLERRPFGPPSLRKEWSLHEPLGVFCLSLLCMEVIILSCVAAPNSITQKGICLLIEFSQTSDAKLLISAH